MGDPSGIGRFLIVSGVILAAIGLVIVIAPRVPGLNRLGRLPGDIFIERGSTTIAIPLVSSIVISVLLTILLNLFLRR